MRQFNGLALKRERLKAGLTQLELAELVGVSRRAIGYYETGEAVPSVDVLYRLAEGLGVRAERLTAFMRNKGRR